MTSRLLIICLALAHALHAAPPPSFVWQGKTIFVESLEMVDETRARLPNGTVIPISAVPPLLRAGIAPVPPPGELISHRVFQILPDGLLLNAGFDGAKIHPVFLRGCPEKVALDRDVTCYVAPDGKYAYTTLRGEEMNVPAYRWTGWPIARPKQESALPGGLKGSALGR